MISGQESERAEGRWSTIQRAPKGALGGEDDLWQQPGAGHGGSSYYGDRGYGDRGSGEAGTAYSVSLLDGVSSAGGESGEDPHRLLPLPNHSPSYPAQPTAPGQASAAGPMTGRLTSTDFRGCLRILVDKGERCIDTAEALISVNHIAAPAATGIAESPPTRLRR